MTKQGIGASLPRREDDRFLRGRGQYVADLRLPGIKDVAFVRSPLAHARVGEIRVPEAYRGKVFTAADIKDSVKPIVAVSALPGFKKSEQPVLAFEKVRQVGEMLAMCVGDTRAEAEDIAAAVEVDLDELPAVHDMLAARNPDAPLVHEDWGDNVFLETLVDVNMDAARDAPIKVTREITTARQCMAPMEGRATVAWWDHRAEQLVIYTGSQQPHIVRQGLAECLGLDQLQIRVISPDVGGGFGYKAILLPEDICLGWLALRCGHPVRWTEDRREHLTASANCREHHYVITAYADRDGKLRGVECEATVDSGAYSSYPFSACLEAAQVASILPGPYDFPSYRCRLANLLGLRYIASPVPIERIDQALGGGDLNLVARTKEGYVYENPRALPRVQFVGGWQFADFESMKLSGRWPETDPQQAVLLDVEPPVATPEGPVAVQAEVKLIQYRNAQVDIEVTTPAAGFVVLNDIWHPWWKAEVDGVETEILKANVLFRAVQVPAGTHKVRFSFQPLAGAIAELRARIDPQEPEDMLPPPPMQERDAPQIVAAPPSSGPILAGPSESVRHSLGLVPTQGSAARNGTASAQAPGEASAH